MSQPGPFRHFVSTSLLAGAAWSLCMVPSSWEDARQAEVRRLTAEAARETFPQLIVLDAGHGGHDGGTQGFGQLEKTVALDLALRVEKHLQAAGCKVLMTRKDDTFLTLEERAALANRAGGGLFVSLHLNADGTSADTAGVETYFCSRKKLRSMAAFREQFGLRHDVPVRDVRSEWVAGLVHRQLCKTTGATDRRVRDSNFVVVMETECPAILVECGYLTNQAESLCFADEGYKESVATAVATGILQYLRAVTMNPRRGLKFEPPPTPDEAPLVAPSPALPGAPEPQVPGADHAAVPGNPETTQPASPATATR